MSSQTNIFLTGATGYIGGSILDLLLKHPDFATFNITVIVRSPEKAATLKTLGLKPVIGSLNDSSLLETLSADADVIFSAADCDDVVAAKAMLRGFKKHHAETGLVPILIHTSGTGVLADSSAGDFNPDTEIYDDLNPDQIETLADSQPHRPVDLALVQADKEGYVKTYIVLPSTIYGLPTSRLADLGIQNPYSKQVPSLIRAALGRGRGGMVGLGTNIWNNVHIDEVAELYLVLFNHVRKDPESVAHGREGFYIGENGEHTLYEVGKAIAEAVVAAGKGSNPEPSTFTGQDLEDYFKGSTFWGTNSRGRANRSRLIGWKPVKTTADLLASITPEIEEALRHESYGVL